MPINKNNTDLETVNVEWKEINDIIVLNFNFKGKLTRNNAVNAIIKWEKAFNTVPYQKMTLVWNCLSLKDYEAKARVLWQEEIDKTKEQIELVYLVTKSNLIKMGAKIMSAFTSFPMKVVESENEIGRS